MKLLEGGLVGAVLGVAAGIMLAPKSGKKIRQDIKDMSGDFYNHVAPKIKKMKHVGEKEFNDLMSKGAETFAKAKKLTAEQQKELATEAKKSWKHINKHLTTKPKAKAKK